jgi:acetyl-CoA decarbonylase/synthase complex subunit delta
VDGDAVAWGPIADRGPAWEAVTAASLLQGGADLLVMRHPQAMAAVRNAVRQLVAA